jgi:hypothetical protein
MTDFNVSEDRGGNQHKRKLWKKESKRILKKGRYNANKYSGRNDYVRYKVVREIPHKRLLRLIY